jgi:ribulose 1,5-bisphosphate carboxylase large subunit-like protein
MPNDLSQIICVDECSLDREEHIIATFEVETKSGVTLEAVGQTIAFDPTIGTWSKTEGQTDEMVDLYSGKLLLPLPRDSQQKGQIRIAIPAHNIDPVLGGFPHLLAILGAPYTLKQIAHIRLINLDLPKAYTRQWPGPRFGVERISQQLGCGSRPIIAMMLKPRVGHNSDSYARLAYEAFIGGVDMVMDDELMVSPAPSPLFERVEKVVASARRAAQETGLPKWYGANITSSIRYIEHTAVKVQELGADFLYVNPFVMGLTALEMLTTSQEVKVPILCCRSGYGMQTRGDDGISFFVLLKLSRWMGADGVHVGSIGGAMSHAIIGDDSELRSRVNWLRTRLREVKQSYPILSGGLQPGNVGINITRLGKDSIIQAGSGVQAHPEGPRAGGKAMRAAVDAAIGGTPIVDKAKQVPELRRAIEEWGYLDDKGFHKWSDLEPETKTPASPNYVINTQGGTVVLGNVDTQGGDFTGRDSTGKKDDHS